MSATIVSVCARWGTLAGIGAGLTGTCSMVSITVAGLIVLECTVGITELGTAALVYRVGIGFTGPEGLVVI